MSHSLSGREFDGVWDGRILRQLQEEPLICNWALSANGYLGNRHRHVGIEMAYCLAGQGTITIGRQTIPYAKGDLVYFDSRLAHQAKIPDRYCRWNLCFWPESLGDLLQHSDIGRIVAQVCPANEQVKVFSIPPSATPMYERLFQAVHGELRTRGRDSELLIRLYLIELHVLLSRLRHQPVHIDRPSSGGAAVGAVAEILGFIETNLVNDLSPAALAKTFHYSPSHVNRLIRGATGMSTTEYVRRRRLARARLLLETTEMDVRQIAARVGYDNVPYFCRVFRRTTGRTPGEHRRTSGPSRVEV